MPRARAVQRGGAFRRGSRSSTAPATRRRRRPSWAKQTVVHEEQGYGTALMTGFTPFRYAVFPRRRRNVRSSGFQGPGYAEADGWRSDACPSSDMPAIRTFRQPLYAFAAKSDGCVYDGTASRACSSGPLPRLTPATGLHFTPTMMRVACWAPPSSSIHPVLRAYRPVGCPWSRQRALPTRVLGTVFAYFPMRVFAL